MREWLDARMDEVADADPNTAHPDLPRSDPASSSSSASSSTAAAPVERPASTGGVERFPGGRRAGSGGPRGALSPTAVIDLVVEELS